ncbi:hypothetical protein BDQ17DRAFT_1545081 [Cyathus striatus]|nr:hypothetical protein BDQ17DRAFT_1545081 [Cyathus striatus]
MRRPSSSYSQLLIEYHPENVLCFPTIPIQSTHLSPASSGTNNNDTHPQSLSFSPLPPRHNLPFLLPASITSLTLGGIAAFTTGTIIGQAFGPFAKFQLSSPSQQDKDTLLHEMGIAVPELVVLAVGSVALRAACGFGLGSETDEIQTASSKQHLPTSSNNPHIPPHIHALMVSYAHNPICSSHFSHSSKAYPNRSFLPFSLQNTHIPGGSNAHFARHRRKAFNAQSHEYIRFVVLPLHLPLDLDLLFLKRRAPFRREGWLTGRTCEPDVLDERFDEQQEDVERNGMVVSHVRRDKTVMKQRRITRPYCHSGPSTVPYSPAYHTNPSPFGHGIYLLSGAALTPIFLFLLFVLLFEVSSTGAKDVSTISGLGGLVLCIAALDGVPHHLFNNSTSLSQKYFRFNFSGVHAHYNARVKDGDD